LLLSAIGLFKGGETLGYLQNTKDRVVGAAKHVAKNALKKLAKKLIKKLAKMAFQIIKKFLIKLIGTLVALIGPEAVVVIIVIILIGGAALWVGKVFGWFNSDDHVDTAALQAAYNKSAISTGSSELYRAPVWLIQLIDNVRILKENRDNIDIDAEGTASQLTANEIKEDTENTRSSWSTSSSGVTSNKQSSSEKVSLVKEVQTWNRSYTYKYILLKDSHIQSVTRVGSKKNIKTTTSTSDSTWVEKKMDVTPLVGGSFTKYTYEIKSTQSSNSATSTSTTVWNGTSSSSTTSEYSHWVVDEVEVSPYYSKFENALNTFGFSQGDFNFMKDGFSEDDPNLDTIVGYDGDGLPEVSLFGGEDNSNSDEPIEDSPNIPTSDTWGFPTNIKAVVTSGFGYRVDPVKNVRKLHKGIDLARSSKDDTYTNYAVEDGTVLIAGDVGDGYGNKVVIDHGGGITTLYGHMKYNSLQVKRGEKVKKGQALGVMGMTGSATGIHLHFEVRIDNKPVNPVGYLRR